MKKNDVARIVLISVISSLIVLSGITILTFWRGLFYEMPPGYMLMTDGDLYTHQAPNGYVAWSVLDRFAFMARDFAWYCYLEDESDKKASSREWLPVE